MRILIFHGYSLRGSGSNVYIADLTRCLARQGHEVQLLCQDRNPAEFDFVDAVGRWPAGRLRIESVRWPARCTAYVPDIGGLLPVYVTGYFPGYQARPFPQLTEGQVAAYVAANTAAVRDVISLAEPDYALANHLVMGPAILARALPGRVPYAVRVHRSALEQTVRPHGWRFGGYARQGLATAEMVLVGSGQAAEELWEVMRQPDLPARTRLPPRAPNSRLTTFVHQGIGGIVTMRILIFHGYLLRGTGSNIYNVELARWLIRLDHEVHLFCQDAQAAELDFVDAVGRWRRGQLHIEVYREPVRCTVYLPDIGGLLPLYVADQYAGFDAKPFPDLTDAEIERYIAANGAAIRDVVAAANPDAALANHLVMGPVILARALNGQVPYAVKIHGSALEYTVRPNAERFLGYAREGLRGATGVLVGSRHTAESLWEVVDMPDLPARTRLLPPGVDTRRFTPRPVGEAAARLRALAARLEAEPLAWGGDPGAAQALLAADPARDRIVSFVGKLIVSKGVDLLIAAWPLVVGQIPAARLIVAGFGGYRAGLMELTAALGRGDLAAARRLAHQGRELEGGPPGELHFLAAFLDSLDGAERERYVCAAAAAMGRVHFAGRIEHDDVSELMCVSQAVVIPSTFPEAFGMVLAEAACCGSAPLSASHSGLSEVTAVLSPAVGAELRPLLSFELGPGAVRDIASKLAGWLSLAETAPETWRQAQLALTTVAQAGFGWGQVATGVAEAAQGELARLPLVPAH